MARRHAFLVTHARSRVTTTLSACPVPLRLLVPQQPLLALEAQAQLPPVALALDGSLMLVLT